MLHVETEENSLDLRTLCCALWRGKGWIIGGALLLAIVALIYSLLARQVWSATAVTERPAITQLGNYFARQQFINDLSPGGNADHHLPAQDIADEVYSEFIAQLASWDTRRDFWLQSAYYQRLKTNKAADDARMLDRLISNIQYQPADPAKNQADSIKLMAENSHDASQLLRDYIEFANQRASTTLREGLNAAWQARRMQLQSEVERQRAVASALYQRELANVKQALVIARKQNINKMQTTSPPDQLADSALFLLGAPLLQARLDTLQAIGPHYELSYDQNQALLATLAAGPQLNKTFSCWRYLRTPEVPVSRDSPRQGYLMAVWGVVGALTGAGIALARRRKPAAHTKDIS
ncbi:polysaccharide chain length modulation protein [Erwinia sp. OLTSP20]|uniref:ECA polysaccharide chain length modulation protein n=1 Tax=unclassified Erwinia TaxID=2622719 RepID=UPI000C1802DE|nr:MULTISPECIES: ECA polysaccharide chain length modulation protein [unclassified Erwinia]PIJ50767.1 polysaccharide chain length modulation protein [Erwinia sp. OAMSP11]PIJ72919.1 polysaccharide chain length modulation protein [Erwinia sp. OLSSP12]PIJ81934.1 polysaccharide chain length modulation protein [Erwinia sp. OLCASP19]PIJ84589.1 polysaccharide chain length modulation protein [Erwinia sp. OLMTSP26]PIJ86936.1 polysaccharide chain length modulation protein [Erwinia sp. OLMDSP33]